MITGEIYLDEFNCTLAFDAELGVIKNGVPTKDFKPVFIGNNEDNDLFGYTTLDEKFVFDIYGGVSPIVKEDSITI